MWDQSSSNGELGSVLQQTRGWKEIRWKQGSQFLVGRLHHCSQKFDLSYTFTLAMCFTAPLSRGSVPPAHFSGVDMWLPWANEMWVEMMYNTYTTPEQKLCPLPEAQQCSERSQSFGPRPGMRTKLEKDQHQTSASMEKDWEMTLYGLKWLRCGGSLLLQQNLQL